VADNELRLVSKIIRERNIKPVLDKGVTSSWFVNPAAREMYSMVLEHWQRYGTVPTPPTVRDVLPGVTLLDVTESYEYLLDQFVDWRRRGLTQSLIQQAADVFERDGHEEALKALGMGVSQIEDAVLGGTQDIDLTRTVDERMAQYIALKELPGHMRGIPTGFPTIDKATLGLQPQQLVTLVALPKVGKSTVTLRIARNVWEFGATPMLVSFEMSNPEQEMRHDAMSTHVSHTRLQSGRLSDRDLREMQRILDEMKGKQPFHLIADPSSTATISGLANRIETYKPDVVFIDGAYLMLDEISGEQGTPRSLTNITRNAKRLAQRFNIPIWISTQALAWKVGSNRKVNSGSIGYSSSFVQDSDVILGLSQPDEEDDSMKQLSVVDSRACGKVDATLSWDWETGRFEEIDGLV
jgi:replicative DNA helicase